MVGLFCSNHPNSSSIVGLADHSLVIAMWKEQYCLIVFCSKEFCACLDECFNLCCLLYPLCILMHASLWSHFRYRFDICLLKQQLGWPDPPFTMPHSEMAPVVMVSVVCLYLRSIFLLVSWSGLRTGFLLSLVYRVGPNEWKKLSGEAMMLENFTAHIILSSKR